MHVGDYHPAARGFVFILPAVYASMPLSIPSQVPALGRCRVFSTYPKQSAAGRIIFSEVARRRTLVPSSTVSQMYGHVVACRRRPTLKRLFGIAELQVRVFVPILGANACRAVGDLR